MLIKTIASRNAGAFKFRLILIFKAVVVAWTKDDMIKNGQFKKGSNLYHSFAWMDILPDQEGSGLKDGDG